MFKKLALMAVLTTTALAQNAARPAAAAGAPGARPQRAPVRAKTLTVEELDGYLAHPEKVLLVDVRRPDEVSTLGGFPVYLSIQLAALKDHFNEIPRDRQIITVSNHAARGGVAADQLSDAGFNVLGTIGADTYQLAGGKLAVKIPVPPPAAGGASAAHAAPANAGKAN